MESARMASRLWCSSDDQACFRTLFCVETYLRLVVRWELRGRHFREWRGVLNGEVVKEAKQRMEQEREVGVIDAYKSGLLSYLNLSELKDIITDTLWSDAFKGRWPSQDIVRSEFKKLLAVRNKVAHFRPVTPRDARVVSRFAEDLRDWTESYRHTSEYASELFPTPDARGLELREKYKLASFCETLGNQGCSFRAASVAHHVRLTATCDGVFEKTLVCALLDQNDEIVTLCRPLQGGSQIEFAIPVAAAPRHGTAFVAAVAAAATAGEPLVGAGMTKAFEVARRENVVREAVVFPGIFRI